MKNKSLGFVFGILLSLTCFMAGFNCMKKDNFASANVTSIERESNANLAPSFDSILKSETLSSSQEDVLSYASEINSGSSITIDSQAKATQYIGQTIQISGTWNVPVFIVTNSVNFSLKDVTSESAILVFNQKDGNNRS